MAYADSHVEFIHHPSDDALLPNPSLLYDQINEKLINQVKPDLLFCACYVEDRQGNYDRLLWIIKHYQNAIRANNWKLILSKNDLQHNGIKVILHIENLAAIGNDLTKIDALYHLGIRSIGLTHNKSNQFAGGALHPKDRLTPLGKQAIEHILALGIILDCAHLSESSFFDIVTVFNLSPFISHAGVQSVYANPRNISDKILTLVREKNGYVGIGCAGSFLAQSGATSNDYIKQIKYAINNVGVERVGIGSDFGGITSYLPQGITSFADLPRLIRELPMSDDILANNLTHFIKRSTLV